MSISVLPIISVLPNAMPGPAIADGSAAADVTPFAALLAQFSQDQVAIDGVENLQHTFPIYLPNGKEISAPPPAGNSAAGSDGPAETFDPPNAAGAAIPWIQFGVPGALHAADAAQHAPPIVVSLQLLTPKLTGDTTTEPSFPNAPETPADMPVPVVAPGSGVPPFMPDLSMLTDEQVTEFDASMLPPAVSTAEPQIRSESASVDQAKPTTATAILASAASAASTAGETPLAAAPAPPENAPDISNGALLQSAKPVTKTQSEPAIDRASVPAPEMVPAVSNVQDVASEQASHVLTAIAPEALSATDSAAPQVEHSAREEAATKPRPAPQAPVQANFGLQNLVLVAPVSAEILSPALVPPVQPEWKQPTAVDAPILPRAELPPTYLAPAISDKPAQTMTDDFTNAEDESSASTTTKPPANAQQVSAAKPDATSSNPIPASSAAPQISPTLIALAVPPAPLQAPPTPSIPNAAVRLTVLPNGLPDVQALAIHVAHRALAGDSRFDIRLDPPELGRIEVRLDVDRHGQVQTHLTAERPQTLEFLQRDALTLERALKDAGLDSNGLSFSLKGEGRQAQGNPSDGARAYAQSLVQDEVVRTAPELLPLINEQIWSADMRLDIRV